MLDSIKKLLTRCWNLIKKIIVAIFRFFKNIVNFFKSPERLQKLKEDKNRIAVAIKEKLDNGDYQVVNCLYDKEENELVDPEEDAQVVSASALDNDTERVFGDKDMIVVQ